MSTTTSPQTTLTADALSGIVNRLKAANQAFMATTPGESGERQPVHTVYGGAQLWKADTVVKMGATAVRALTENAPNATTFAKAIGLPGAASLPEELAAIQAMEAQVRKDPIAAQAANMPAWLAVTIYDRVLEKLKREAVEDFRIDFEDGYGNRADDEEDGHAVQAAQQVAAGLVGGTLPPFLGIRIKPLT